MTNLKERFAQWSRQQPGEGKGMSIEQMDQQQRAQEEEHGQETALHAGQQVDVAAGTEAATGDVELEQLRGERDQLLDRLARLQAEFDNTRKREIKERADARDYATQSAIEPFLGVMDNFALALKAEGDVTQLRQGVELIVKQMDEALRTLNVQAIEAVGAEFDPRIHEALGSIETVEHPDHQVLEEIRRGYKLREKLLRPALVRIASNTAQRSE